MNRATTALVLALLALGIGLVPILAGGGELGVTNFDSLTLSDDLVVGDDLTISGDTTHTGQLNVVDDLKVGNGTPTLTLNGEDAYVEGTFEVDGASNLAGAMTLGSTLDVASTLNYGTSNHYPLGHASSGLQAVQGTASITTTGTAAHGLTTVTWCLATMGEDPTAGAGDAAHVTVAVAANACTLKAWQDDFVTAATETEVAVHWLVIGTP